MTGIIVTRGARTHIPEGGLQISMSPEGEISSTCTLHVGYEAYPQWLLIAAQQAELCEQAALSVNKKADAVTPPLDEMEMELRAGMQAIVAAAIAIDGFYGSVVDHVSLSSDLLRAWRKNNTARHKQISETFRQAFQVGPKLQAEIQGNLEWIFDYRNEAVHPTNRGSAPVPHPRLHVDVERRLAIFTAENSVSAVRFSLSVIGRLIGCPKSKFPALKDYCEIAKGLTYPLADAWDAKRGGRVFERK